eukprot:CAMPEP_0181091440 /NCGR_PEP_ID=MMETSP1071-20121207/8400_1 /TAXON_ID=35127 /ORGANISM="Thalassiosira sp., Strain NH16" /LENGTH=433 /DNA_ID=CAMNT_0023173581 /DNA_START=120 /DNA_END=1418 /DNA_ORIENTATION=+
MSLSSSRSSANPSKMSFDGDIDSPYREDKIIRWAIVGLGDVCAIKSGPAFYKCRGSTLSAVMRRTPGAAQEWMETNAPNLPLDVAQSMRAFDSVEVMMREMMTSEEPLDAIYVATPPGAHLENIRQIVTAIDSLADATEGGQRKLKAVYVEKPCGRCAWETRAMVDELSARDIKFYPAYVSRSHERTVVLRGLLGTDKVCGDMVTAIKYTQRGSSLARGLDAGSSSSIPWRLNAEQSGGGLIMDMGCHLLDRIDYLFGPLENIKSKVLRKGGTVSTTSSYPLVEDYVSMSATIGDCDWSAISSVGATVECVWDFSPTESSSSNATLEGDADELVISGPKGSLRMAGMGAGLPIELLDNSGRLVKRIEFDAPKHAAQPLIQTVVDELLGLRADGDKNDTRSVQSPATAANAVRTSEVLDAILGSYYGGRHDDFW